MNEISIEELAALDAAGALTEEESAELRQVSARIPGASAAIDAYREAASSIATSLEPVAPPPAVRDRLMALVHGKRIIRGESGGWSEIGSGLRMKKLVSDRERNTVTLLLEFAAGAKYPGHAHHGAEDSYVVRGSCRFGDIAVGEGDLFHVEPGEHHGDVVSESGCLLLIVADYADFAAA